MSRIGLFRIALGCYFVYYYVTLLPDFLTYFGPEGMFRPDLYPALAPSLLFLFWDPTWIMAFLGILLACLLFFIVGYYPKFFLLPLLLIHISFNNANPIIIHEPQPIANLLLFCCFFLPLRSAPFLGQRAPITTFSEGPLDTRSVVNILIGFLALYYFLAGSKKLLDPLWLEGEALEAILRWPALGKESLISDFIVSKDGLARFLNYATLAFELSFPVLVFTRFRPLLFLIAFCFQLLIYLTLEVGSFAFLMMAWQVLLLDHKTVSIFRKRPVDRVLN